MSPTPQIPERSVWPSASRGGAGAVRLGFPSGRRGIPGVGRLTHCASVAPVNSTRTVMVARAAGCAFMSVLLFTLALGRENLLVFRGLRCRWDHLHQVRVGWHQSQRQLVAGYPRLGVRLRVVDRDGELQRILVHAVVSFLDAH